MLCSAQVVPRIPAILRRNAARADFHEESDIDEGHRLYGALLVRSLSFGVFHIVLFFDVFRNKIIQDLEAAS